MIKERIAAHLQQLMKDLRDTQESLASRLGITKSSLQGYLKGANLPGIDILLKMAELGGITVDELIKKDAPLLHIEVKNSKNVAIAGRDVYVNTKIHRKTDYSPGPDDIAGDQANRLKTLVSEVVELEQQVKKKPKTYGAVWNALNRKMGITYYREIKRYQFDLAELYLMQWKGRIRRGLKRTDEEEWRKKTQASIFARARNQLGWTKDALDSYILERYGRKSIRDLKKKELQQLYNIIFSKR